MKTYETLLGKRLDPFSGETKQHIALVAFLAWIGLGADGLHGAGDRDHRVRHRPVTIKIPKAAKPISRIPFCVTRRVDR
jgi:hypothetical protein